MEARVKDLTSEAKSINAIKTWEQGEELGKRKLEMERMVGARCERFQMSSE